MLNTTLIRYLTLTPDNQGTLFFLSPFWAVAAHCVSMTTRVPFLPFVFGRYQLAVGNNWRSVTAGDRVLDNLLGWNKITPHKGNDRITYTWWCLR